MQLKFFTGHQFAASFQKQVQHNEWLSFEIHLPSAFEQFSGDKIYFKKPEAHRAVTRGLIMIAVWVHPCPERSITPASPYQLRPMNFSRSPCKCQTTIVLPVNNKALTRT